MAGPDPVVAQWLNEKTRLIRQIERAEAQIAEANDRLNRVQIAIDEYQKLTGARTDASNSQGERGDRGDRVDEIVLQVIEERAPRDFDAHEVLGLLQAMGWTTQSAEPTGLIQTYLSRLKQSGRLVRVAKGRYAAASKNSDGSTEAEPSEPLIQYQEGGDHHAAPLDEQ